MERFTNFRGKALVFLCFLCFIWFINFSARIIFSPVLPVIEDEFMVKHAQASSIFIFLSIGYGVAMVTSGFFSGKIGYKKSIILALLHLSLVSVLIPLVHNFVLLYLFSFLLGFSVGLYLPSVMPLITEYYDERHWGKAIAIHDVGASSAVFATPFIALFFLQHFQWRGVFLAYACIFIICSIILFLAGSEVKNTSTPKTIFKDIVRMRSLWLTTIIWTFSAGANLGIYSIAPLYLTKEIHLSIDFANAILGISRLASIGVAIACGFLVDRFNIRNILFNMLLITGIFTIFLGLVPAGLIGVVLFLQAFFVTGIFPVGLVAIARMFRKELTGPATGIIVAVSMVLGGGIVPFLLGVSGDLYSFRLGITILGILMSLVSACIFGLKELAPGHH